MAPVNCVFYDYEKDADRELLVAAPHDKIYYTYLCALIDYANGEYDKYQNTMVLFNAHLAEYAKWCQRHGGKKASPEFGWYISAYSIAVKHGFAGSEEQWLRSLKGEKGERGQRGEKGEAGEKGETGSVGPEGPRGLRGVGVESLELLSGDHSPGTLDTYRITFSDGAVQEFQVYNGADGSDGADGTGSGDMHAAVYDTDGDGIVDNAAALGGKSPEHFAPAADLTAHLTDTGAHSDMRQQISQKAPAYSYGTEDLVAGVSVLETGRLYFVYE
ncbi:MAG: collagen-like protein [Oscillospiraceae bacterium]|nr:collagen-like protein [Oscillospiraceae bacterium]